MPCLREKPRGIASDVPRTNNSYLHGLSSDGFANVLEHSFQNMAKKFS
jgi:hypothetical protein